EVQDKILAICAENLAPDGVAYVSYNTYPGWHALGMVREMIEFHVRAMPEPEVQVQQARALLEFVTRSVRDPNSPHGRFLKEENERLKTRDDTYLFHEYLEEVNQPI